MADAKPVATMRLVSINRRERKRTLEGGAAGIKVICHAAIGQVRDGVSQCG